MKLKKLSSKTLILLAIPLVLFAGRYVIPGSKVTISVGDGWSARQVASELKNNHVIGSRFLFRVCYRLLHGHHTILAGKYTLRTHMPAESALRIMLRPPEKSYRKVVIPEGWRMEQVAERLEAMGICGKDEFLRLARAKNAEGHLFPSTYMLEEKTPASVVFGMMTREFEAQVRPLLNEPSQHHMDEKQVLIIASIVEREAVKDSERPLIAAVYINRFRRGMALEADPTVQYALGWNEREQLWWEKGLTLKDLKYDSPYNTYRYRGLPPGPICSASIDSIKAALHPAEIDALYFVADGSGYHVFNSKFSEHLKAKDAAHRAAKRQPAKKK